MAADASVNVFDFEFIEKEVQVGVGETVTWNFVAAGHTTTSDRGQPESWNSGPARGPPGTSFQHTFDTPGRFSYVCIPHQSFMKGTVVVGTDEHRKSQSRIRWVRRGSKVTFSFTLVEAAKVEIEAQRRRQALGHEQAPPAGQALDRHQEAQAGSVPGQGHLHRRLRQEVGGEHRHSLTPAGRDARP